MNICKKLTSKPSISTAQSSLSPPETQKMERESATAVIADLENRGYEQASKTYPIILSGDKEKVKDAGEKLIEFMTAGADEFEKKVGRPMTYSEMRAAWG